MVIHRTFNDFVLFLYVYMAFADGEFHPLEREVIRKKMAKLFPELSDKEDKIEGTVKEYHGIGKKDLPTLIRDTFDHFKKVKAVYKYRVYTDMYDIINADGKVDESETAALEQLKEIINVGGLKNV